MSYVPCVVITDGKPLIKMVGRMPAEPAGELRIIFLQNGSGIQSVFSFSEALLRVCSFLNVLAFSNLFPNFS